MTAARQNSPHWYRSFYWRIGLSFLVLVVGVLVAQSAMFNYLMTRSRASRPNQSPNNLAAIVAADVSSTLTETPYTDLQQYVTTQYGGQVFRVYLLMKDGRIVANTPDPLADGLRQSVEAVLNGTDLRKSGQQPVINGPVVTAPIQVDGELRGMVVLPPPPSTTSGALEHATQRLGAGDLTVRASESGGDEIARVAAACNRMASELAEREDALHTSDRLRRQMLADVSHELKTPLTAMRGYLETLRMPDITLDQQTRDRYLETIEHETLRLDRIVKDLVDLARVENAAGTLDVRWFAIATVFAHAVQRHDYDAKTRNVAIRPCVAKDTDQILGDPDRLAQVVENLVANALRHTPDGGTIELRARTTVAAVVLTVADSGVGIAPEHLPHVFDRIYKVDAARTHGENGSGLGLSIVKAIVDAHHGTIGVASQPGRTVFTIELPRDQSTSTNL